MDESGPPQGHIDGGDSRWRLAVDASAKVQKAGGGSLTGLQVPGSARLLHDHHAQKSLPWPKRKLYTIPTCIPTSSASPRPALEA